MLAKHATANEAWEKLQREKTLGSLENLLLAMKKSGTSYTQVSGMPKKFHQVFIQPTGKDKKKSLSERFDEFYKQAPKNKKVSQQLQHSQEVSTSM